MRLVYTYFVSLFINSFIPGSLGGELYRAKASSIGIGYKRSGITIMWDRIIGIFAQIVLATIGVFIFSEIDGISSIKWIVLAMLTFIVFLIIALYFLPYYIYRITNISVSSSIGNRIISSIRSIDTTYLIGVKTFSFCFFLSMFAQMIIVLSHYCVLKALCIQHISFEYLILVVPLATLLLLVPITVNGIGFTETIFVFFFSPLGVPVENSIAFAWLLLFTARISTAILGGVLLSLNNLRICKLFDAEKYGSKTL